MERANPGEINNYGSNYRASLYINTGVMEIIRFAVIVCCTAALDSQLFISNLMVVGIPSIRILQYYSENEVFILCVHVLLSKFRWSAKRYNGTFSHCLWPLQLREAWCTIFHMCMSFICMRMEARFKWKIAYQA